MWLCVVSALLASMPAALPEPAATVVMVDTPGKGPPAAGVVVSPDGLIVTTVQAVGNRRKVRVHVSPDDKREAKVAHRDDESGLALLDVGALTGRAPLRLYAGPAPQKGETFTVHGVEGGLPWQSGTATVVATKTGPWGDFAEGFITLDGKESGTGADQGAAVLANDGALVGVHLGRLRAEGAPAGRFIVVGVDRLRGFLVQATEGLKVGRLCVETSAPGARVFVDGNDRGSPGALSGLPTGWHEVRVTAPGHANAHRILMAGLEEPPCVSITLRSAASVVFKSPAPKTFVSVDGAPWQELDGLPLNLPAGPHELTFVARGWRPFVVRGDVAAGEVIDQTLALVREHGLFSVTSLPPGATVLIEGRSAGTTPLKDLKLSPGTWKLELQLAKHRPAKLDPIKIRDGQTVDVGEAKLRPMPAMLRITGGLLDDDDEVFLNGRRMTGSAWRVEPGYHDLEVRRKWHSPGRLKLLLQPEEDRTVAPRPEPLPERRERIAKMLGGFGASGGAFAMVLATVGLVAGAVGMWVATYFAYDRYHALVQREEMQEAYRLSNGLLWGGLAMAAFSTLTVLVGVASVAGGTWAFLSLPTDPSEKAPAPPPGGKR